ncbi:hypothetical protein GSI_02685 [Ganoderma sinense ZZ0214-1]|uniref:Protein kinase domain-containing protein n=1 Tax=Ganoderma sinense ZZ0214-1 TaxID=1077348 RepID=A0A2G8SMU5_9APHY|nr:hypothetical protein GSI_02685 [Ganoderma sinense ZZ0214-1]
MPTVVRFMINIDPHYHEATFDCPYQDITAKDVLDVAPRVCMDFYHLQTSGLPPPKELARREMHRLHYITDQATAFNLDQAYQARYDIRPAQRSNTDVLKQALGWYRAMGHYHEVLTGLKMMVMEEVQGDTLDTLSTLSLSTGTPISDDSDVRTAIERDIVHAVRLLHENNLVHGDVRGSHVVIQRATGQSGLDSDGVTRTRAYLLKFNWAGEVGQARYPCDLDRDAEWAEDWELMRRSFITKADDEYMLGRLRESLAGPGAGCRSAEVRLGVREGADSDPDEVEGAAGVEDEARGVDTGDVAEVSNMDVDSDDEVLTYLPSSTMSQASHKDV